MERIEKLRREIGASARQKSAALVGDGLGESGRLDRAVLNQQIQEILQEASLNRAVAAGMADQLETFLECANRGDVPGAAEHVSALLSVQLDDLRKAAILSLLVRMSGRRQFEPIAAYLLEKLRS
jgi:RNA 3'-terminal phosphate cyclase